MIKYQRLIKKISQIELIEKFPNVYQFCSRDLNKFYLLLIKGIYPYEYMDSWKKFNETELPPKKQRLQRLNLEDISDKTIIMRKKYGKNSS